MIVGIHLDGMHLPVTGDPRRLEPHRPAPRTDVPDDARRREAKLGQRQAPHLGRRQQPALGTRLEERIVGIAEQTRAGLPRLVDGPRLPHEDQDIERAERLLGDVGEASLRDALVGGAEVFADIGLERIDPFVEEGLGHRRRRPLLAREQADGVAGANAIDDSLDRLPGEVGKEGLLPALLHPGKRQLHAADVRHDLEPLLAELAADIPGGAVEEGIARGEDHHPATRMAFDPLDEIVEPAGHFQSTGDRGGKETRA